MLANKNKISLRQALFILLTSVFSPAIRFIPRYTAYTAKQAAYLSPFVSFLVLYLMILLMDKNLKKHGQLSILDTIYAIVGRFIGKILFFFYILWLLLIISLFTRYYGDRLVTSLFPNTRMNIFIIVMFLMIFITIRFDIVILARMNDIVLPLINIVFLFLVIFLLPKFEIKNVTPISYLDIIPIFKSSLSISSLWGMIFFVLLIDNKINNIEKLKTQGLYVFLFLAITTSLLIAIVIGTLGYRVSLRAPLPFLAAVKLISIFDILEKVESIVVVLWILTDFVLISILSYVIMELIKSLFDLEDEKPLAGLLLIILYFTTMFITQSKFDLELFSTIIANPVLLIFTIIIPYIIFLFGLIKKKAT